ncbi:MAG: hypothetical protein J6Y78_09185 [Paludibacteraceae bacterium]|nr:hypothetical protein [Paludibacteraceae bacterium]
MILAWNLWNSIKCKFPDYKSAAEYTRISEKRIRFCISSGQTWKGWCFDEE